MLTEQQIKEMPLSDFLLLAKDDMIRIFRTPGYVLNMDVWHDPREDGKCHVCLAGAVLTNFIDSSYYSIPSLVFDDGPALDHVRSLNHLRAADYKSFIEENEIYNRDVIEDLYNHLDNNVILGEVGEETLKLLSTRLDKASEILKEYGL